MTQQELATVFTQQVNLNPRLSKGKAASFNASGKQENTLQTALLQNKPGQWQPKFETATKTLMFQNEAGQRFSWASGATAEKLFNDLPSTLSSKKLQLLQTPKQFLEARNTIYYGTGQSLAVLSETPEATQALSKVLPGNGEDVAIKQSLTVGNCYYLAAIRAVLEGDPKVLGALVDGISYNEQKQSYTVTFPGDPQQNVYTITEKELANPELAQRSSNKLIPLLEMAFYQHIQKTGWGLEPQEKLFSNKNRLQLTDGGFANEAMTLLVKDGAIGNLYPGTGQAPLTQQVASVLQQYPNALLFPAQYGNPNQPNALFVNEETGKTLKLPLTTGHVVTLSGQDEQGFFVLKDSHYPEGTFRVPPEQLNYFGRIEVFVPQGTPALNEEVALTLNEVKPA